MGRELACGIGCRRCFFLAMEVKNMKGRKTVCPTLASP